MSARPKGLATRISSARPNCQTGFADRVSALLPTGLSSRGTPRHGAHDWRRGGVSAPPPLISPVAVPPIAVAPIIRVPRVVTVAVIAPVTTIVVRAPPASVRAANHTHLLDFRAIVCRDGCGRHRGRCGRGNAATKRGGRKNEIHLHHSFASSNRSPLASLTRKGEFSGGTSFGINVQFYR
jgi:hypothetical protein